MNLNFIDMDLLNMKNMLFATVLSFMTISTATAGLISLDTNDVIGSTPPYDNRFLAEYVLDNQSGVITEVNQLPNDLEGGYWLNPNNGTADAWITIDLGSAYVIDFVELFNTHNAQYFDRGTGDFRILASNSVTQTANMGFDLTAGSEFTLIDSTLLSQGGLQAGVLDVQSFSVGNNNAFRYLQFNADSVAVGGQPCCGANNYGLNEIRVFSTPSTAVPEPSTLAILSLALIGFGCAQRRRK